MKELPNVETLSPPPTDAEVAWWNGYRRRKRWRGMATRFLVGVSGYAGIVLIRYRDLLRTNRGLEIGMAIVFGIVVALLPQPNTDLFDQMTAAIRDRRVRDALRAPPKE